jgi:hypothetical protein
MVATFVSHLFIAVTKYLKTNQLEAGKIIFYFGPVSVRGHLFLGLE